MTVEASRTTRAERQAQTRERLIEVARELFLSEGTVRNHLSSAIGKTGARTRAEAVRVAIENGWLPPS